MAKHPDYPRASSFQDRHDKTRWRFLGRKGQKNVTLPGSPGSHEFDAAYQAATLGRTKSKGEIIQLPTAAHPRSMRAAYRLLKQTDEWRKLDERKTRDNYIEMIEEILAIPAGNSGMTLGDGPMADLKRSHIKQILAKYSDRPFMERRALTCLRKLIVVALDEEWISGDPAYGVVRNPKSVGFKAWTAEAMAKYETRWKIGTPQRTAYALGLWLGNRVSDVALLRWSDLVTKHVMIGRHLRTVEGFEFVQFKGRRYKKGTTIFLPMTPMLARELAPLTRDDGTVLKSEHNRPYDSHSISTLMIGWREEAGIVNESFSMHGLRKSLGVKLALADATTRQMMEALGHTSIAYTELYSREASKVRLAVQAFDKVTEMEEASRKKPALRVVK
jgi:integrase